MSLSKPVHGTIGSILLGAVVALAGCAGPEDTSAEDSVDSVVQPLVGAWQWFDVPGSKCGNGSQTGFAINVGTTDDVVIYMEGGGFCFDDLTCNVNVNGQGIASWFTAGFDGARFRSATPSSGIFDRNNVKNPYRSSNIVYVPYCTGDFHSGNAKRGNLNFNGRANFDLYLSRVKAAFPSPSRVTLTGASAGGFGALFNYGKTAETYAGTRVDMVSDSGPAMWNNALVFAGVDQWNTAAAITPKCPECVGDYKKLYGYYSRTYPSSRFALLSFDRDRVIATGYALLTPLFANELRNLVFNTLAPLPNVKHFVPSGTDHTMLYALDTAAVNGRCNWFFGICFPATYGGAITVQDWLTKMYTDDPTWTKQSALLEQ